MTVFTLYDESTAPTASAPLLKRSREAFGMIPNLHAVMAEAPGLLEGYQKLHELFTNTSFDADEQTVVWQTINVEHGCAYCVPAHTAIAQHMGVSDGVNEALRDGTPLPSARLEALRTFTLSVVRNRGQVTEADVQAFLDAGFTPRQIQEVILGLSQKVMSNYLNHVAQTPIDEPFRIFEWQVPAA
jgi:alkylhydroperoxidase family enzyme